MDHRSLVLHLEADGAIDGSFVSGHGELCLAEPTGAWLTAFFTLCVSADSSRVGKCVVALECVCTLAPAEVAQLLREEHTNLLPPRGFQAEHVQKEFREIP